jgi:dephospho-CoA kinase
MRVGLTGGMASGKSTVARRLAERGFLVVDADRLVAELYQPGQPGAQAVAELFGAGFLAADGAVDRPRLAERVFSDAAARKSLEARIHPLVRQRFAAIAAGSAVPAVLEATLLVEAGYAPGFDLVVTVEADPELRLARAIARGLDAPAAHARLAAQGTGAARRAAAQRVITNDVTLEELEEQADRLAAEIRSLSM